MKLIRPLIFAVAIAGAFFYFTTWRSNSGELRSTNWFSRPDRVEITEAAPNEPLDGEEQNNISVYRKNIPSVVNVTSRAMTFDFFYGLVPQEGQGSGFGPEDQTVDAHAQAAEKKQGRKVIVDNGHDRHRKLQGQ